MSDCDVTPREGLENPGKNEGPIAPEARGAAPDLTVQDSGQLVIGLIAPVGANIDQVNSAIAAALEAADYEQINYRLSDIFAEWDGPEKVDTTNEFQRIWTSMDAGDKLRELTSSPEIMARQAVSRIAGERIEERPHARRAHVLRSLKRPEEVQYLRHLYGPRFILISVFCSREDRIASLQRHGMSEAEAIRLAVRDEGDGSEHGQATRDAFELADLFLEGNSNQLREEVQRFIDLILGSPLYTPHQIEHGMFLAYATSLRSGDLSRQVGAVLTTADGIFLAEGCNDAPRFDGRSHWPGAGDRRDLSLGYDSNERAKQQMLRTIVAAGVDGAQQSSIRRAIERSGLLDITEYGRAVHAEMAALMACARQGTPTQGARLYCTTFPCHNCAKHIIAAGIHEVLFIEPYPKSRALSLHDDALTISACEHKVHMRPFVGVGPRRYQQLFALQGPYGERVKRKERETGNVLKWDRRKASPAFHDRLVTYLKLEDQAVEEFGRLFDAADERLAGKRKGTCAG